MITIKHYAAALALALTGCRFALNDTDASDDTTRRSNRESGSTIDLCSIARHVMNNTPESALPIDLSLPVPACIGSDTDVDFYAVEVPVEDRAGGYFTVSVTNVGESGRPQVGARVVADNAALLENTYADHRGGPLYTFFSGAPGEAYTISVTDFSSWYEPWPYTLQVNYTPFEDAFEPNDTRDEARPLLAGVPVEGYVATGYRTGYIKSEQFDDWFEVELAPGAVDISVTNVPRDIIAELEVIDPTGIELGLSPQAYGENRGADLTATANVRTPGLHKLRLGVFAIPSSQGKTDIAEGVPDSFERPYNLLVTQL